MRASIQVAPPNSLLIVCDVHGWTAPKITPDKRIWSAPSCIIVGCLAFMDGSTQVVLGDGSEVDPGDHASFDDMLFIPAGAVAIKTVEGDTLLQQQVRNTRVRVRIWTNHPTEPNQVIVGLS